MPADAQIAVQIRDNGNISGVVKGKFGKRILVAFRVGRGRVQHGKTVFNAGRGGQSGEIVQKVSGPGVIADCDADLIFRLYELLRLHAEHEVRFGQNAQRKKRVRVRRQLPQRALQIAALVGFADVLRTDQKQPVVGQSGE